MLARRGIRQTAQKVQKAQRASKAPKRRFDLLGDINAVRSQSTTRASATTSTSTSGTRLVTTLATGAVVGGLGGFLVADLVSGQLFQSQPAQKNYEKPKYGGPKEVAAAKEELRALFPTKEGTQDAISDDPNILETYGFSHNSYHPAHLHSMVVHVQSTEDVVNVVNVARKYRIPVTAYSGGTSLEGNFSGVSASRSYSYIF